VKARGSLTALALAAACCACAAPVWAAPDDLVPGVHPSPTIPLRYQRATWLESAVLAEINRTRARAGLYRLRLSRPLANAAASHSSELAGGGYFEHTSLDGLPFWNRIARFYSRKRWRYWAVGENLSWTTDAEPMDIVSSWLQSPSHRPNLMSRLWREVGLGAISVRTAAGVFGGTDVTILTADFGIRR
jgi:uncharacterized protein YkwD